MKLAYLLAGVLSLYSFNAQALPTYVPANGLVAWYPFNHTVQDESGNNHHGVNYGATFTVDRNGNKMNAVYFDGNWEHIKINDVLLPNTPTSYSISFWMKGEPKMGDVISDRSTLNWDYKYRFVYDAPNIQPYVYFTCHYNAGNPAIAYSSSPASTQWQHIVLVLDVANAQMRLYRNAVLEGSTYYYRYPSQGSPTYIGKSLAPYNINDPSFKGAVDDLGFWSRALTQTEINDLYCATNVSLQPSNINAAVGSTASFTTQISSASSFQWQKLNGGIWQNLTNGGQYSGCQSNTLNISNVQNFNNGEWYRCQMITNFLGCVYHSDSVKLSTTGTSVKSISQTRDLSIYPNPVKDILNIHSTAAFLNADFEIFDMLGRSVAKGKLIKEITPVLLQNLVSGSYLGVIRGKESVYFKISKMK